MELSNNILNQQGWDKFDIDIEKKRDEAKKEALDRAQLFFKVFGTEIGQKALEELIKLYVVHPIANPKDDLLTIGIREGQSRLVKWLLAQVEIARKG